MAYKFETIKVLVVEDNKPMMDLMKSIMKSFGVGYIVTATNGEAGFEKYRAENPDIIITDWMMEPGDGITLTKQIRSYARGPNPYVPIILMTGFSEKRRVISARDSGITEFIVKPFNVRELYKRIQEIIENPRQFVESKDFFGPDRRRKVVKDFSGQEKRGGNPHDLDFSKWS